MNLAQLVATFGDSEQVSLEEQVQGFPLINIRNAFASATISLYGGQVLAYRPLEADQDLLFLSQNSRYQAGKAIRGGIPICWPWFGPDPDHLGRANHGLARNRLWQLQALSTLPNGETELHLSLRDDDKTRKIWDFAFNLAITIKVGQALDLTLTTHNQSQRNLFITQALHSYFSVGDSQQVKVLGLDGLTYLDKVDSGQVKVQQGQVTFIGEIDRIYQRSPTRLTIEDPCFKRRILINGRNSKTSIVWNPGAAKAAAMTDLMPDSFRQFICVETANAGSEVVQLSPGATYELGVTYDIESTI